MRFSQTGRVEKMAQANEQQLPQLRQRIDAIDQQLVSLLAERFAITHNVGLIKKTQGLPAVDAEREARQTERIVQLARDNGLDEAFAIKFLRTIIDEVVSNHQKL